MEHRTKERLRIGIVDVLCVDASKVHDNSVLSHDLGADSLDMVELLMWAEEEFNIEIPDDKLTCDTTVEGFARDIDAILGASS